MAETIGLVLAGGDCTRFVPFVTHKALFPVMGRPLLFFTLDQLAAMGINKAVVVIPAKAETAFRQLHYSNLHLTFVVQPQSNGMGQAVLSAAEYISGRPVLVCNAVELYEPEYCQAVKPHLDKKEIVLAGRKVAAYFPGGYFVFQGDRPVGIVEKPGQGKEPSDMVNMVTHYFPDVSLLLSALPARSPSADDHYEQALSRILKSTPARIVPYAGHRVPVKFGWDILGLCRFLLNQKVVAQDIHSRDIAPSAVIDGPVYIGHNVTIREHATIKGPCWVGDNVVISQNCLIRESVIENHSTIGYNSEIARSYIGAGCSLHTVFIGDSVLENRVHCGAGTKTANLRLDENPVSVEVNRERIDTGRRKLGALIGSGANFGINSGLMPGIVVGTKAVIGPHTLVTRNITAGSLFYTKLPHKVEYGYAKTT